MATPKNKPASVQEPIQIVYLNKKDAGTQIGLGVSHLHSTLLGNLDPLVKITRKSTQDASNTVYPWEPGKDSTTYTVTNSSQRHALIRSLTKDHGKKKPRSVIDKGSSILEELLTNAIYHAFKTKDRSEKYSRKTPVKLQPSEEIFVTLDYRDEGLAMSVEDGGGSLRFEHVANALKRCYSGSSPQIQSKESGAGLGIYMVFELSTHLKIEIDPGRRTRVSVWISDRSDLDPDTFSFNFFDRRKPRGTR